MLIPSKDRLRAALEILVPFVIMYFFTNQVLLYPVTILNPTIFDLQIDFNPHWVWIYILSYPFIVLPFFTLELQTLKKNFTPAFLVIATISFTAFLFYPTAVDRALYITDQSFSSWALNIIRLLDAPTNCVPSLHISTGVFSACVFWVEWSNKYAKITSSILCALICFSTLTTKQHYMIDVTSGFAVGLLGFSIFLYLKKKSLQSSVTLNAVKKI